MVRRLLLLAAFLLLPTLSFAQTSTVTGHILYPSGGASANGKACFTLQNFKPNSPRVSGTGVIVQNKNFCVNASSVDGSFSTTLYRNDQITPGSTYWRVDFLWNGQQESSANYSITTSTYNLDTATPMVITPLPANGLLTSSYNCQVSSALSTWTCTHNFNDKNVTVTVYDLNGAQIFPNSLTLTNANTVTLTWVTPQAGNAVIIHASAIAIANAQPNAVLQAPSGAQVINSAQSLTINAATTNTGNNIHTGTETFLGAITACQSNGAFYVGGGITCWAGADIAAQINTAYAALPALGGRIHVISQASCYAATTAISFSTVGKPALLEGDPGGSSCISWSGASSSIISILLDWGTGEKQSAGVRDLQIIGPGQGTTSTGIMLGTVNGAESALITGIRCGTSAGLTDGFGTCMGYGAATSTFTNLISNSFLMNSGTGLGATQGSEGLYVSDSLIARNTTGVNNTAGTNVYINGSSIDDNGVGIASSGGGTVECFDCHFENLGVPASASSYVVLTNSGGFISYGGSMQDDSVAGTITQFIQGNSGACYVGIFGTQFTTLGRTVTEIATLGANCRGHLFPRYLGSGGAGSIQTDFNQSFAGGPVLDCPMGGGLGVNNVCGFFGSSLQFRNGAGFVASQGGNLYTFSITNPGAPRTWSISDQNMALWGTLSLGTAGATTGAINLLGTTSGTATITGPAVAGTIANPVVSSNAWQAAGFLPSAAGASDLGSTALPHGNLWLGTAATNNYKFQPAAASGARIITIADPLSPTTVGLPLTIASGTTTLTANAALAAVTSQAANTTAGTGILTTDVITWSFATAPTAGDNLCHVLPYVTAGNVNFVRTNPTAAAQNVSALVINWKVVR